MELLLKIMRNFENLTLMHCRENKITEHLGFLNIYNNLEIIQFDCFERTICCLGYGRTIWSKFETRAPCSKIIVLGYRLLILNQFYISLPSNKILYLENDISKEDCFCTTGFLAGTSQKLSESEDQKEI